jgi:hypothetical protein
MTTDSRFPDLEFFVGASDSVAAGDLEDVHALFARAYDRANHAYLDHSLSRLGSIALARTSARLVGLALADTLYAELPGFADPQLITLGGIGCIDPTYRRTGVFSRVSQLATRANGLLENARSRVLACGRMGHPAGFRNISRYPTTVPKAGVPVTKWQLAVGAAVARLYGVTLKSNSLVVAGSGTPIGYPKLEIDVADEEWLPFRDVDRERGDSLLGLAWIPDAPDGWEEGSDDAGRRGEG